MLNPESVKEQQIEYDTLRIEKEGFNRLKKAFNNLELFQENYKIEIIQTINALNSQMAGEVPLNEYIISELKELVSDIYQKQIIIFLMNKIKKN